MPNYCKNLVEFKCPDPESFHKLLRTTFRESLFSSYFPLDEAWTFDSAVAAWGTKWNPIDLDVVGVNREELILLVHLNTAWTPPHTFLKRLRADYNIVSYCFFFEPDMNICGMIRENGDVMAVDVDDVTDVFPDKALELLGLKTYHQQFINTLERKVPA
jgi:hypothetical protein